MCIAIAIYKGKQLEKDVAERCWKSNRDGAGFCFPDQGKVKVIKGLMTFDEFWDSYSAYDLTDVPHLIHFRIKTSGKLDPKNTHPWKIAPDLALVHNGMLHYPNTASTSDTGCFAYGYLRKIRKMMGVKANEFIMNDPWFWAANKEVVRGSKMLFLDGEGNISIINQNLGDWADASVVSEDGKTTYYNRWFSNSSWKARNTYVFDDDYDYDDNYFGRYDRSGRYPRSGHGSDHATMGGTTKVRSERIGRFGFVPQLASFRDDGTVKSKSEILKEGWVQHKDGSWDSPKDWTIEDEGGPSEDDSKMEEEINEILSRVHKEDEEWMNDESIEEFNRDVNSMLRDEERELEAIALEQDARKHEMSKTYILKSGEGSSYSIRRSDISLELVHAYGISWTMIEQLTDDELLRIAEEQGAFVNA